jgi:hypothetical protein
VTGLDWHFRGVENSLQKSRSEAKSSRATLPTLKRDTGRPESEDGREAPGVPVATGRDVRPFFFFFGAWV